MDYIEDDEKIESGEFRQSVLDDTLEFVYTVISQVHQHYLLYVLFVLIQQSKALIWKENQSPIFIIIS